MKIITFFKEISPIKLVLISVLFGVFAKFIERFSKDFALGLQLVCFGLVVFAIIKYFESKN
jgi:hypothetical protein